jgi:cytochrome oxidase Cu insertion factor (SCO1/SenC/PrrC family)
MISADPERDSALSLADYIKPFVSHLGALRPADGKGTEAVAEAFGILFEKGPPDPEGGYAVLRTVESFLLDPEGSFQAVFSLDDTIDDDVAKVNEVFEANRETVR